MGASGISPSFPGLFQSSGQVPHVLLTRSPLTHVTRRSSAFDLHVLGPPPAFVLSQDQTLRQNLRRVRRSDPTVEISGAAPPKGGADASSRSTGTPIPTDQAQVKSDRPKPATVVRQCIELFRVRPATTRDRRRTARTGFFVLYPDFKEQPMASRPPGTRSPRRDPVVPLESPFMPDPNTRTAIRGDHRC